MAYTKVLTKAPEKRISLRKLIHEGYDWDFNVPRPAVEDIAEQCGMALVYSLPAISKQNQARLFARELYNDPAGDQTLAESKALGQIIFTDVVESNGKPDKTDPFYESKMVSIERGTAGPVTVNPNTGNHVRHFTITSNMLLDIYYYNQK